jgi:hypothetical protein
MTKQNLLAAIVALTVLMIVGIGCKSLMPSQSNSANTSTTSNASNSTSKSTNTSDNSASSTANPDIEKADFTTTSEDLDREYTRKGVTDKDLEKYSNKNIAVTGRVTMLVTEKKGTTQPWVTLAAPGLGHGVNCYFDDENVGQMKLLKEDKIVKIQGFQDDFIVPEISPMLKHCVVLEGAK